MKKRTMGEIQSWLVSYIAAELQIAPDQIPIDEQFVNLGLSSRQAIMLTGDLEEFLDCPTDPALAWEYPTIRELAQHLAQVA
jgi:8-amino-7-oxononanoate synthase